MTGRNSRRRRLVTLLLNMTAVALLILTTGTPALITRAQAATGHTMEDPTADTSIAIASFSPATLRPGQGVTVRARVTAGVDGVAPGAQLELRLQRSRLSTRYGVSAWSTADINEGVGTPLVRAALPGGLKPGASTTITLQVPAEQVGLPDTPGAFGPRGVALVLRDGAGSRLAVNRTFLVWYPAKTRLSPVKMSVVMPVLGGRPSSTGLPNVTGMTDATNPSGRLTRLLAATNRTGVALAVDPSLLVAQGGESAQVITWRRQLIRQARARPTIALPSANPDIASLAHGDAADLFTRSVTLGRSQAGVLGSPITSIAVPAEGSLDDAGAAMLHRRGYTCAVLRESHHPSLQEQVVTPTGRSSLVWPGTSDTPAMCGLLADDALTDILAGPSPENPDIPSGVAAVLRMAAETAAIAEQNPARERHLLALGPAMWNPGTYGSQMLGMLLGQPWVKPAPITGLAGAPPATVARNAPTITDELRQSELDPNVLAEIKLALAVAGRTSKAATAGPEIITSPLRQPTAGLLSQEWRGQSQEWARAVETFGEQVTGLRQSVRVLPGSDVNQVSQDVKLPVTIANNLPTPVTVYLRPRPTTNLLQMVQSRIPVNVPAGARAAAYIPVRGVGSGQATVRVGVETADGFTLDNSSAIRVRVRADWENRATYVAGAFFGVILVVGIIRTLRRGQTRADTIDPTTGETTR